MGFVGRRLVEMLVERGATRVVAFDIAPKPEDAGDDPRIVWMQGDLTNPRDVDKACEGSECVWHIAALVGPYHALDMYMKVNYQGTVNVIDQRARSTGVKKIVMSSSPLHAVRRERHQRSQGDGAQDPEKVPPGVRGEQVQGRGGVHGGVRRRRKPVDGGGGALSGVRPARQFFLHNFLLNAKRLRVFGDGENLVSVCYVDNYCHGLILGERALYPGSPAPAAFTSAPTANR